MRERGFEDHIERWLIEHGGYHSASPGTFDRSRGLHLDELYTFIADTQSKQWERLIAAHGGDATARDRFADRLASEIDERGTVDVLRHGVTDHGVRIDLAYFKPAHTLTPELARLYEANRLAVIRQFAYDPKTNQTIDLALLVNGIPTATAELKNAITGQTIEHAVAQYRTSRDPRNVTLSKRALVHFAVDTETVKMTTRLAGQDTVFWPFNLGDDGGAGNPPNRSGHRTFYLWEWVWRRDAWLDLLDRFVHVEEPRDGSKAERRARRRIIFPRFHQRDAVLQLVAHAGEHGAGHNYLVQHSAGSGKSNTIAWLAHRLSNLHDDHNERVFHKIIVITDRLVLDRQLQDTIYQFEHAHGVVERVDQRSDQLADALTGAQAQIIITTMQKFPFVVGKIGELPDRRYAVIVDEAHSSQTGETAVKVRGILGAADEADLAGAETQQAAEEAGQEDPQDLLAGLVRERGRQPNLSYFAFTATPKAKTLELFGTPKGEGAQRRYEPFHLYSMRQAIEEGFIHDVLKYYTTYQTYFRIEKAVQDDPDYDKARARAAIARFVRLHPHNLSQKAEIIVEHFRNHTARKIRGHAKAMVVTSSRLHAVRYKQAIDRYITDKGYDDIAALVAFSGKVIDDAGEFTESGMNQFPESETAQRFDTDDYQVLIVAEKFQTGFDQPLLHTMYVDKTLTGLNAVQTLSRLNRIHPNKDETFVLDFRNDAEAIQEAFAPWYERATATPTDPNVMYDSRREVRSFDVLRDDDIAAAVAAIIEGETGHARLHAALSPAVDRFSALDEDDQDGFRDALARFVSQYRFISQIVPFTDTSLEADYLYCRALETQLPGPDSEAVDLGSQVKLTHLRIEKTFEGTASIDEGGGELESVYSGAGKQHEPDEEPLSRIIDLINERFGLNLTSADQLLFDQYEQAWLANDDLAAKARSNDETTFRLEFEKTFLETIVHRMDSNEEIFKRLLDDDDFRGLLIEFYLHKVYSQLREG